MDKNFNDEELSDIMKEIEALEEDFASDAVAEASPVLAELAEMSEEQSIHVSTANIVSLESKRSAPNSTIKTPSTAMSFKVQGNLTLELNFEIGGKTVALEVTEAGLNIELDGGMKFTVPVNENSSLKKAV